jgi:tight adherence protein B
MRETRVGSFAGSARRVRCLVLALVAAISLLASTSAAHGAGLQVVPASSAFPQRALVVSGAGIGGLTPPKVHIVEDGARVRGLTVRSLRQPSSHDFGLVLVIDVSPNVGAIERAVAAARGLAAQRPNQAVFGIVEADAFPPVALALTHDSSAIQTALATTPVISRHGQHVYDAVLTAVGMLRSANIASGSVIVLSDGADRGDPATLKQVLASAGAGHIRIFSVGIFSPHFDSQTLTSLTVPSGGQFIEAGPGSLGHIFTSIESRLSSAYLIRYFSAQHIGERIAASMHIDGLPGTYDVSYSSPPVVGGAIGPQLTQKHAGFWTSAAVALLVSLIAAVLLGIAVWALLSRREGVRARVGTFVSTADPVSGTIRQRTLVQRALGDARLRARERPRWFQTFALELDIAQVDLAKLVLLTLLATVLLAWLLVAATSSPLGLLIALVVPVGARMGVRFLANRQRRQFEEQLPDNLQVVASALRAGHTFLGALGVMVQDAPEPSRRELRRALADEQLGVPLATALNQVSERMKSVDFQQVTLVATLQRDTGGNTAEIIDVVTETIRDRLDLRRLVRSLTAQGRLAGGILTVLPVALLIAVSLINPDYTSPLFHKAIGIIALVIAGVMAACGGLLIRRIINIEV